MRYRRVDGRKGSNRECGVWAVYGDVVHASQRALALIDLIVHGKRPFLGRKAKGSGTAAAKDVLLSEIENTTSYCKTTPAG